MLATALIDRILSPGYPDLKRNRSLYMSRVTLENSKEGWTNGSSASFYLLDRYVSKLKKPEKISIFTYSKPANAYVNNKKIVVDIKFTDDVYWDIAEYTFLEGKPYTKQQVDQAVKVGVISEAIKKAYFGDLKSVVGKYIEADNVNYQVVGVVKDLPATNRNFYGGLYLPYTVSKSDYRKTELLGGFGAVLLARNEEELPAMRAEYDQMLSKVPIADKSFDRIYAHPDNQLENLSRQLVGNQLDSGLTKLLVLVGLFVFLFLLLPTINLVNINITRIMERSSEIGVRKAFGASSKTLVYQFLVENVILTFLGGLIGVMLSIIAIMIFNRSNAVPNLDLSLNFTVLFFGLVVCLLFGLLSGVYPAWRMSRLNVVSALKSQ
jgi:putative ABC transport system permease protein